MKVILLKDVKNVGKKDEVKEVSDGYARNYLFAHGLAVQLTKGSSEVLTKQLDTRKEAEKAKLQEARENASKLEANMLHFKLRVGDGRAFGSITTKHIKDALFEIHNIDIDKKKIGLTKNIDNLGQYVVPVELHKNVTAKVVVSVEAE